MGWGFYISTVCLQCFASEIVGGSPRTALSRIPLLFMGPDHRPDRLRFGYADAARPRLVHRGGRAIMALGLFARDCLRQTGRGSRARPGP